MKLDFCDFVSGSCNALTKATLIDSKSESWELNLRGSGQEVSCSIDLDARQIVAKDKCCA